MVLDVDDGGIIIGKIRSDRLDSAIAHVDVEDSVPAAGGVDQSTAFQQVAGKLLRHLSDV